MLQMFKKYMNSKANRRALLASEATQEELAMDEQSPGWRDNFNQAAMVRHENQAKDSATPRSSERRIAMIRQYAPPKLK